MSWVGYRIRVERADQYTEGGTKGREILQLVCVRARRVEGFAQPRSDE